MITSKKGTVSRPDTRARILGAAEQLFAEHGFAAMSLRELTRVAEVNLAAVNYHFGSKERLMWEVLRKHIEPINRERLKLLDEAERAAGANPVPLDKILDTLLLPLMEAARTPQGLDQRLMRIVGRTFSESAEFCKELHREFFKNLSERFRAALRRTLPDLSEKQLNWRFYLMICLMLGALSQHHRLEYLSQGNCDASAVDEILAYLKSFVRAGLSASAVEQEAEKNYNALIATKKRKKHRADKT